MTSNDNQIVILINSRFDAVERRFDAYEVRLNNIDTRLGNLETQVGVLERKVDNNSTKIEMLQYSQSIYFSIIAIFIAFVGVFAPYFKERRDNSKLKKEILKLMDKKINEGIQRALNKN